MIGNPHDLTTHHPPPPLLGASMFSVAVPVPQGGLSWEPPRPFLLGALGLTGLTGLTGPLEHGVKNAGGVSSVLVSCPEPRQVNHHYF